MELIVGLIVQLVAGAVGGAGLGQFVKQVNLGVTGNAIAGAIGGVGGTYLASLIPGLDAFVGMAAKTVATAATDATSAATTATDTAATVGTTAAAGGLDFAALTGQGVTGLVCGAVLTGVAGLVKNTMMKN